MRKCGLCQKGSVCECGECVRQSGRTTGQGPAFYTLLSAPSRPETSPLVSSHETLVNNFQILSGVLCHGQYLSEQMNCVSCGTVVVSFFFLNHNLARGTLAKLIGVRSPHCLQGICELQSNERAVIESLSEALTPERAGRTKPSTSLIDLGEHIGH